MGEITNQLDSYDINVADLDQLYKIYKSINDNELPIVRFIIQEHTSIFRQRNNNKDEKIKTISGLTYPSALLVKEYGRANIPFHPMFYASIYGGKAGNDEIFPRITCLMETSAFYLNKSASGIQRVTISKWDNVEPLQLIALPFDDSYNKPCKYVSDIVDSWKRAKENVEINPNGLELITYMSREIAKKVICSKEYIKIANFINYLLTINVKTKETDGIVYPSIRMHGAVLNIALKPEAVDHKLKFEVASLCHYLKRKDQSRLVIMNYGNVNSDGVIEYKKKDFSSEEKLNYNEFAKGLDFIN